MKNLIKQSISLIIIGLLGSSCHKKDNNSSTDPNPYNIASVTYNFSDANYKQQMVVLNLADSLLNDLQIIGQPGATAFSASQLASIYDNTPNLYSNIYNGVSLSGLVGNGVFFSDAKARSYFDSAGTRAANSNYLGTSAANNLDSGLYLPEYYEKLIMGAVIYNQANIIFAQIPNAANDAIDPKYGTSDMVHMWDELFGYMCMPVDYPSWSANRFDTTDNNPSTCFLFGEYIGHSTFEWPGITSQSTNYIQNMFNAFIIGRIAIKNKDYAVRDAQLATIKKIWEDIIAFQAISYARNCIANINDPTIMYERWSEMTGFVHMFQFNPNNKLGSANINLLYTYAGNQPADATTTSLNNLISLLKSTYGF